MIEWKCIDEFPDYEISTSAEVRNKVTMQVLRQVKSGGYVQVIIDRKYRRYVHRLVGLYHTEKAKARIRESVKRTKFLKKGGDEK